MLMINNFLSEAERGKVLTWTSFSGERILVPTRLSSCYAFSLLTTQRSVIAEDEAIATQSFGFIETMDLDGPRFPQSATTFLNNFYSLYIIF